MASHTPVVATRVTGIPEIVEQGVTGLVVEPGSPVALAEALAMLLADPPLCRRLGNAGRRRVEERFALRVNAGRLHERLAAAVEAGAASEAPRERPTVTSRTHLSRPSSAGSQ